MEESRLGIPLLVGSDVIHGNRTIFPIPLAELVEAGEVPLELVDEAVRRVLRLKFRLGLFENPYTDESLAETLILQPDFRELALEVAQECMVQLYVRDLAGSVTRPVRELKGFQKISLQPGEQRTVCFEVPVCKLGFTGLDMGYSVEPSEFKLWLGPDSTSGLEGEFAIKPAS